MTEEVLAACIRRHQTQQATRIVLHHFGEPLLHPQLQERLPTNSTVRIENAVKYKQSFAGSFLEHSHRYSGRDNSDDCGCINGLTR